MDALTIHHGKVVPLDRANVDTDAIIPAEYLKAIARTGFADGLFTNWRYLGQSREPNPDFVLNMPRYQGATILLARVSPTFSTITVSTLAFFRYNYLPRVSNSCLARLVRQQNIH